MFLFSYNQTERRKTDHTFMRHLLTGVQKYFDFSFTFKYLHTTSRFITRFTLNLLQAFPAGSSWFVSNWFLFTSAVSAGAPPSADVSQVMFFTCPDVGGHLQVIRRQLASITTETFYQAREFAPKSPSHSNVIHFIRDILRRSRNVPSLLFDFRFLSVYHV